jgi:hypothetical protein
MTKLDYLKFDLETHTERRDQLKSGKAGKFISRAGYPVSGVIASYDKIIASLEEEIAELEGKKKTPSKKQSKKKAAKQSLTTKQ